MQPSSDSTCRRATSFIASKHGADSNHALRDQQVTGRAERGRVALRAFCLHVLVALAVILHDLCEQEARGVRARYPRAGFCEDTHARPVLEELAWDVGSDGPSHGTAAAAVTGEAGVKGTRRSRSLLESRQRTRELLAEDKDRYNAHSWSCSGRRCPLRKSCSTIVLGNSKEFWP